MAGCAKECIKPGPLTGEMTYKSYMTFQTYISNHVPQLEIY